MSALDDVVGNWIDHTVTRLRIFLSIVFRRNVYDFIFWPLFAWDMAGTLAKHFDDWRKIS